MSKSGLGNFGHSNRGRTLSAFLGFGSGTKCGLLGAQLGSCRGPGESGMPQPLQGQCRLHSGCFESAQLGQALQKSLLSPKIQALCGLDKACCGFLGWR